MINDYQIIKDLYQSKEGLYAFTFYKRYSFEPEKIFRFIHKYQEFGFVKYCDDKVTLTEFGRKYFLKKYLNIKHIKNKYTDSRFDNIPDRYKARKIGVNEPYLPNIKELPNEIMRQ